MLFRRLFPRKNLFEYRKTPVKNSLNWILAKKFSRNFQVGNLKLWRQLSSHFKILTILIHGCLHIGHPWSAQRQVLAQSSQATKWLVISLLERPKCKNAWVFRFSIQIIHRSDSGISSSSSNLILLFSVGFSEPSKLKVFRFRELRASGVCGRSDLFWFKILEPMWLSTSV